MHRASRVAIAFLSLPLVFAVASCKRPRRLMNPAPGPLSGQSVTDYDAWGNEFSIMLVQVAQKYEFPIGMDLESAKNSKLASRHISHGNVGDVLNSIVSQEPDYQWSDVDGVINVTPKHLNSSVLDIRIADFRVTNADSFEVHDAIMVLPELKSWLQQQGLKERTVFAGDILIGSNGTALPGVSIDLHDVTLRTILNTIIKSGLSSWKISRWRDKKQYISISVG